MQGVYISEKEFSKRDTRQFHIPVKGSLFLCAKWNTILLLSGRLLLNYICWCKWIVKTKEQFDAHLQRHIEQGDYDIPLLNSGTNRPHPWTFSSTKIIVIQRDMKRCKVCGKVTDDFEIHHIMPRWKGGSDHPANLILLCCDCHNLTKNGDYGGIPLFCILPDRKQLVEGQKTIGAYS